MDGSYLNKANLALAPLELGNYTITIYHEVKCNTRRKKTQAETELCQAKILIFPNLRSYNFQSFPNLKNLPCPSIFIWNAFLREHDKKICVKFGNMAQKGGGGSRSFPNSKLGTFCEGGGGLAKCSQSQMKNVFYYDPKKT